MPTAPDAIAASLARHVLTGYRDRDDAAHLETLAPEAYVIVGGRASRLREAERAAILADWAELDDLPSFGPPEDVAWLPEDANQGMATALLETVDKKQHQAAFGLVCEDGSWRVAWSCLFEGEVRPHALMRLASHAELTTLDAARPPGPARTLLDLAYLRMHRLPEIPLLFLPETRFSCQGSGACCTHPMTIGIDANSATFIEQTDWQALDPDLAGPFLHPLPEGSTVAFDHMLCRDSDGRCRFLTDDRRCSVHSMVGRAVFKPCHVFPYLFTWCPDGVCVTTHHLCPSARWGIGARPEDRLDDIRSRMAIASSHSTDRYKLLKTLDVSWPTFREIEKAILDLLDGDRPLRSKLWAALCWLQARLAEPDPPIDPAWFEPDLEVLEPVDWEAFEDFVALFDPYFRRLETCGEGPATLASYEPVISRWFRQLVFSKAFTYPHGLVGGMNDLIVVLRILERQFRLRGDRGVPDTFWRDFFGLVTTPGGNFRKYLSYSHGQSDYVLGQLGDNPRFGLNLLLVPRGAKQTAGAC